MARLEIAWSRADNEGGGVSDGKRAENHFDVDGGDDDGAVAMAGLM